MVQKAWNWYSLDGLILSLFQGPGNGMVARAWCQHSLEGVLLAWFRGPAGISMVVKQGLLHMET